MKTILIILGSIAAVLGLITYFVLFSNTGSYVVTGSSTGTASPIPRPVFTSSTTSTASGTSPTSTSTPFSNTFATVYSSDYSFAPVTWKEGSATLAVTGASYDGSELTLKIGIAMGNAAACVPMNIRFIGNESGALVAPEESAFSLPPNGNCNGTAGQTYKDQPVIFRIDPSAFPALVTTGGASGIFFQISTTTAGGVDVSLPSNAG